MIELIPYHLLLGVHIGAFLVNIALVIVADCHAASWLFGWQQTLSRRLMTWLHRIIGVGLAVSIVSGFFLFLSHAEYLLAVPSFYVKIGLVAALVVNAFVIGRHVDVASEKPFRLLTAAERRLLFVSGAVSTMGWVGVCMAAQLLGL